MWSVLNCSKFFFYLYSDYDYLLFCATFIGSSWCESITMCCTGTYHQREEPLRQHFSQRFNSAISGFTTLRGAAQVIHSFQKWVEDLAHLPSTSGLITTLADNPCNLPRYRGFRRTLQRLTQFSPPALWRPCLTCLFWFWQVSVTGRQRPILKASYRPPVVPQFV